MRQVCCPIMAQEKNLVMSRGSVASPFDYQVIYHNVTSQSLFGGPKLQREKARCDLHKAWAASLLFQFDPWSCGLHRGNEPRIETRDYFENEPCPILKHGQAEDWIAYLLSLFQCCRGWGTNLNTHIHRSVSVGMFYEGKMATTT